MNPKSILSRIRGFSIMGTGVSWNASTPERQIAGKVVSFFEDRRVLYNNYELEMPEHCVKSILEIRKFLTEQVGILKTTDSSLTDNLKSMNAACRKFLNTVQDSESQIIMNNSFNGGPESWTFLPL